MVLVDTSVLIGFLKNQKNSKTELLEAILTRKIPWGINDFIYQEILQGAKSQKEFESLKEYFETVPSYFLRHGSVSYERAAILNIRCRNAGVTIRSTIDLLIAETAIENDVFLLHNDRDFDNMETVVGELRSYEID